MGVALLMAAAGFAQFSPAAALADVARHFGELGDGDTISEQAGLPGSVLGAGLATIRLSALVALPLAAMADRFGRRRTVVSWVGVGLAMTAAAATSPGYWWFVLAFAAARPLLTATNTIGQVLAAEHTGAADRAKALAFATAAYGVGAGAVAVVRGVGGDAVSFRAVFALALVPLLLLPLYSGLVGEPDRFRTRHGVPPIPVLAAVGPSHRRKLLMMAAVGFASGFVTGPLSTLLFLYAENVVGVSSLFTAVLVVAAGASGLLGLLLGRAAADHFGRRPTAALALVLLAATGIATYSGSVTALAAGYLLSILAGAAYGPPALALATELFPTRIRAAVAGWLVVAGVLGATAGLLVAGLVADRSGDFATALSAVCIPAAASAALFWFIPETRGLDLEESAPDEQADTPEPGHGVA